MTSNEKVQLLNLLGGINMKITRKKSLFNSLDRVVQKIGKIIFRYYHIRQFVRSILALEIFQNQVQKRNSTIFRYFRYIRGAYNRSVQSVLFFRSREIMASLDKSKSASIQQINYKEVVMKPYMKHAILHSSPEFKEDYLVIHSLIRKYEPNTFIELGTNEGGGTKIICKAMGIKNLRNLTKKVYSIELPPGTDSDKIFPYKEVMIPKNIGELCPYTYTQLFGDSTKFDYSPYYPLDGWFIDAEHSYGNVTKDSQNALKANPKLIMWHDMQIAGVESAVIDVMQKFTQYKLFRVTGTRIAYAIKE